MWKERLDAILSSPFELLQLQADPEMPFVGRYIRRSKQLYGLGREIARGAEAVVFELVHLEKGELAGVVKICHFPPGTLEYEQWAVPFRFDQNPHSTLPDIELQRAELIEVPGGVVKVQELVSADPERDWAAKSPMYPVAALYKQKGPEAALEAAEVLIAREGGHGILLEIKGRILSELQRLEEARDALEAAMAIFPRESRAGFLRAGWALAQIHQDIYRKNEHEGAAIFSLDFGEAGAHKTMIFTDPAKAAMDDTSQDRALYTLFEVLAVEPYFIPGLLELAEELRHSWESIGEVPRILDAIETADPGREDVVAIRKELSQHIGHGEKKDAPLINPAPPAASVPKVSDRLEERMKKYDTLYQPEPQHAQSLEARLDSFDANLSRGRVEEAERAARDAIRVAPNVPEGYYALSMVLWETGRLEEAAGMLERVVGRMPVARIYEALGHTYELQGKLEQAEKAFLRSLVSVPSDRWELERALGVLYKQMGRRDSSLKYLRSAHDHAPDDGAIMLDLANVLRLAGATSLPELEEALNGIDAMEIYRSSGPYLLFCKAQILCQLGKQAEAIPVLQQLVTLSPKHPDAQEFLAALRGQDA